jgi:16S rRNA (guanine527-N7)-methyltransferase
VSLLVDGAKALGIELSAGQLAQLDQYSAALREWNKKVNLTRIVDPAEIEVKHFLDSLTAAIPFLDLLRDGTPVRLVDVGSGAGFPGLPLKIAFPSIRLTLIESIGKKVRFLEHVVDILSLKDVAVLAERAETVATWPEHRDSYQWATARALGRLPVVIEVCAPLLEPGGLLVAQRRGDLDAEILRAARVFGALQMWAQTPIPITLPGLMDGRGLVVGEKHSPTPSRFPRRPGLARKEPLA